MILWGLRWLLAWWKELKARGVYIWLSLCPEYYMLAWTVRGILEENILEFKHRVVL